MSRINLRTPLPEVYDHLEKLGFSAAQMNPKHEFEKVYTLAAIRRTLSLIHGFILSTSSGNEQLAATILRLNLDTLSRFYALYWADDTEGMTADTFAREVFNGKAINTFHLRNQKASKATDSWLISQIEPLAPWITEVYKQTSGAVHFSNFHMTQLLNQSIKDQGEITGLLLGATEKVTSPEQYKTITAAFTHTTVLLITAMEHRITLDPEVRGSGRNPPV